MLKTAPNILPGGSSLVVPTTCQSGLEYETDEDEFDGGEENWQAEVETVVKVIEADLEEFSRKDPLGILPGGSRPDTTPAVPAIPAVHKHHQVTVKRRNIAKRNVTAAPRSFKRPTRNRDFNLGYFNLWWNRMEREGQKEEKERLLTLKKDVNMERLKNMLEDGRLKNCKRKRPAPKSKVDDSRMNPSEAAKDVTIQEWTERWTSIDPDPMGHPVYLVGGEIRLTGGNTLEGVEVGLVPLNKII